MTYDRYLKRLLTILGIPAVKAPGPNAAIRLAITLDVYPSHGFGMIDVAQLDLRPADIALAVGYANASQLSRDCSDVYGAPPQQLRREYRQALEAMPDHGSAAV